MTEVKDLRKLPINELTDQAITGRIHLMQDNLRFLHQQENDVTKAIKALQAEQTKRRLQATK